MVLSHKEAIRAQVWQELRKVAYPDSRFHYDFSSFIADFVGSQAAADQLLAMPSYSSCSTYLREKTLQAGIKVLITTYGIRRGFWLLDPAVIQPELYRYASTLDGLEKVGQSVSLAEIASLDLQVGFMVTGTGAINHNGIRFGKGHGFFDLEWAMLYTLKVVHQDTMTAAVVHDCQVLDEELIPETYDTVCNLIVTPTRALRPEAAMQPTCGILWYRLENGMLDDIPPLQELLAMEKAREEDISSD
ncbi:uncharacterized protein PG986_014012 [Apiospora aurea]|uniref:5-formyltetrahydrofolate cyclo-ligase n=1 Tax=Apiospora aurea TaxID=335848 RepID=A0ABR1PX90_9PEZI